MDIKLAALEQTDLGQLRDWRNSDWLRPFVREYRLLSMNNQVDWFNHISSSDKVEMFGIEIEIINVLSVDSCTRSRELIGVCGLCNINWVNRTAEISLYIEPDKQGAGIGLQTLELLRQKAFEEFNLRRLWAEIFEFNTASIALFEKCGYEIEGNMREHIFKQGRYHNSLIYGLIRRA